MLALSTRIYASHAKMKYRLLQVISNRNDIDYNYFVTLINSKKRNLSVLKENFDIKILATAAPYCYARIIADNEKFDVCIATHMPTIKFNKEFENSKEVKKDNILKFLESKRPYQIDTVVTDHIDDLSILKLASRKLIVNPSEYFRQTLKKASISYSEIL